MDIIDSKYIGLVSSRLQKFKRVKADLFNFRCPICGDSQKHKNKARGYFYQVKTNTNYKCHNCGASMSFNNFLKQIDSTLHKQYTMEKFKEGFTGRNFVVDEPKLEFTKPIFRKKIDLPRASEVPVAKNYLEKRNLDASQFYFAAKFKEWTNTQKHTFDTIGRDESRIIIPMYDTDKNLIGFQGRSLAANPKMRYITVMLDENSPKLFGLDTLNENETIYIVEGPFDSFFLENSVAMCGSDVDIRTFGWSDYIWVYDNEPRNRQITDKLSQSIDRGEKVVVWPKHIRNKDLNDMVNAGVNVKDVIQSNVYQGLKAKLQLSNWKI